MEHENRLELNRYSKSFVGPSATQEADSVIVGSDKEKKANTCAATREAKNFMETFIRRNDAKVYSEMKSRCASERPNVPLARSLARSQSFNWQRKTSQESRFILGSFRAGCL